MGNVNCAIRRVEGYAFELRNIAILEEELNIVQGWAYGEQREHPGYLCKSEDET